MLFFVNCPFCVTPSQQLLRRKHSGKYNIDDIDRKSRFKKSSRYETIFTTLSLVLSQRKTSEEIMKEAVKLMPGGVNSPVRAFRSVGGNPIVFKKVKGSKVYDVDGNEYIDYVGTWGPAIVGHANDEVVKALKEAVENGTSFGAPCELENILARMVIDAVPSVEMVRFVNSGTEACMSALRLMRAYTGREKIIKFAGCFHGHADPYLVQAGSGVATLGLPDSPGVPKSTTENTLTAPYNDYQAVENLFHTYPNQIAGVILEPVVGNSGFILPDKSFLEGLRSLTRREGALLCFDEVMTGFRISYGGAQKYFNIQPDLTTFGKIIGGGLPVGAYGGRKDIMEMIAPSGPVYQSGTLSGNPLAMTAGIKTLEILKRPGTYEYLEQITSKLVNSMVAIAQDAGHAFTGGHLSAMFGFFFTSGTVKNFEDAKRSDLAKFQRFHRSMLEQGIYLAPSQFEAGFISLQHSERDIEETLQAFTRVMKEI
ncbi:Glutamate-1-semialdehyde 2,1-aminomutase [Galdieria sulphuraria]|nr:Glutamate-1-semialdehyde 2,1-aminomutase [Galdieria sulphuraria]